MNFAPVILFVYSRPWHTRRTVEALLKNELAKNTDLIIFSDYAKTLDKQQAVNEVRDYINSFTGFRSIQIVNRSENYGLAKSIIHGVSEVLHEFEKIIVLEDDMLTSSNFLTFMNNGLNMYAEEPSVASIHGYIYPVDCRLPDIFFIRGADCWGWATWRRAWSCFNPDGRFLLNELERKALTHDFDFNGAYPYTQMLRDQIAGRNNSWAIRWYASAYLQNMFTLYPGRSFVRNIGLDGSGTHCGDTIAMDVELNNEQIQLAKIPIVENFRARAIIASYLKSFKCSKTQQPKGIFRKLVSGIKWKCLQ